EVAAARSRPTDGALSLAHAFQLMTQALGELRGPVTQEALRLRMAALHGKEDALLDTARFPRLLRQANDAEIADVRKVGDDDYEISPRRIGGVTPPLSAPAAAAAAASVSPEPGEPVEAAEPAVAEPAAAEPVAGSRENGQRFGVRFRRGSRGGLRTGEIPLIGVVQMDTSTDAAPVQLDAAEQADAAEPQGAAPAKKTARPRRAPRKKAAATKAAKPAKAEAAAAAPAASADDPGAPATPVKRTRSRARKKAE
ncbi:MAG: hypothetical protein ACREM9_13595, partial [Gemmatimonadales bacterium]